MSEKRSKLAIAASLLWLALASFVILGTHADVVAGLAADEVGITAPAAGMEAGVLVAYESPSQC